MNSEQRIWCLHGNLQRVSAWNPFQGRLRLPLEWVEIYDADSETMDAWINDFCAQVESNGAGGKQVLLGYSMGGRLALQALVKAPHLWDRVIVVSADPGEYSADQKEKQLAFDKNWAARFSNGTWPELMNDWNAQGVFCGIQNPAPERESDFTREQIARLFDIFSKGRQPDLVDELSALREPPVLFISGGLDGKYSAFGRHLADVTSVVEHITIPGAGHRVPWEAPELFIDAVNRFLNRVDG